MAGQEMNHRELIAELVEALEILLYERDNFMDENDPVWVLDPAFDIARALIDKAKAIEDCIPIEDAYEVALDQGL
ncbi:hypothetical protein LCGC14_2446930 [marine sediment metagenome]|uniref:Uncharacterized protein n=1 Tax=marine sediment metagenome TaxID=412755 RepID=A0A0F9BHF1_9ZZZZ